MPVVPSGDLRFHDQMMPLADAVIEGVG